ncbi:hypothetical protein M0R45_012125 [Rubus argutus]|uniref:Uncharacterized protein n=1 Tax=Rubus argutus TaxID=59490 RepID=A0AAW1YDQ8_RUBAR
MHSPHSPESYFTMSTSRRLDILADRAAKLNIERRERCAGRSSGASARTSAFSSGASAHSSAFSSGASARSSAFSSGASARSSAFSSGASARSSGWGQSSGSSAAIGRSTEAAPIKETEETTQDIIEQAISGSVIVSPAPVEPAITAPVEAVIGVSSASVEDPALIHGGIFSREVATNSSLQNTGLELSIALSRGNFFSRLIADENHLVEFLILPQMKNVIFYYYHCLKLEDHAWKSHSALAASITMRMMPRTTIGREVQSAKNRIRYDQGRDVEGPTHNYF